MDVPFSDAERAREWMDQLMEKLDVIYEGPHKKKLFFINYLLILYDVVTSKTFKMYIPKIFHLLEANYFP